MNALNIGIVSFIILHAFLMLFDEFYFHRKRGLGKWERLGHPIDTFFTLICVFIVMFFPMEKTNVIIYFLFAIFSCFIIVKDEHIHLKFCDKYEQFIHAILFIMHPIYLAILFLCWPSFSFPLYEFMGNLNSLFLKIFIYFEFISIVIFFIYQIFYWNFIFKGKYYAPERDYKQ